MQIGNFTLWMTAQRAAGLGCTNHAKIWGIIPGFSGTAPDGSFLWIARSDLLYPLEDFLNMVGNRIAASRGEDMAFGFQIGPQIIVRI